MDALAVWRLEVQTHGVRRAVLSSTPLGEGPPMALPGILRLVAAEPPSLPPSSCGHLPSASVSSHDVLRAVHVPVRSKFPPGHKDTSHFG